MRKFRVVILGASGAVGSAALQELLSMPEVEHVTALARRGFDKLSSPKLKVEIVNVTDPESYAKFLPGHDVAICTFGVGQPTKVSKDEFKTIDHDAVLAFAQACKQAGLSHFELLGSVAADESSRSYYLASKGQLRQAISTLGFERFSCFQPSVLLTRYNRYGFSQAVLLAVWPTISALLPGPLRRYRGIRVESLGKAMAINILTQGSGTEVLHWDEFQALLSGARR